MRKNFSALLCATLIFPFMANANQEELANSDITPEIAQKDYSLKANIKRIALEYMEHSVTNKNDPNYPDTYSSDENSNLGGTLDANLTYEKTNMVWVNGIFAEYALDAITLGGSLLLIFAIIIVVGLLPIIRIVEKVPQKMITKYDI